MKLKLHNSAQKFICSSCGANTGKKPLNIRKFDCPNCNTKNIDRDINASINIRNYGLGQISLHSEIVHSSGL